ncbi:MAG: aspartate/glutamate racemase family protein [Steroidobacteraceae bacterium]|jgi:allantoin racemase
MRIKIVNPNTTSSFTEACLVAGRAAAAPGTELSAGQPSSGTPSVECHVEEAVATLGVIEQVRAGEAAGIDGYVIACFGDTGIGAAREIATGPVVGMTEAALYTAALIAPVFAIVTLPVRTRIFAERVLWQTGLERRCARVRAIDIDVLDCEDETVEVFEPFVAEARRAIVEDHAEAIILGCAGLQPLIGRLEAALGVPIIEGVAAAVKLTESLLSLRLATSKRGAWGYPLNKAMSAASAALALGKSRP